MMRRRARHAGSTFQAIDRRLLISYPRSSIGSELRYRTSQAIRLQLREECTTDLDGHAGDKVVVRELLIPCASLRLTRDGPGVQLTLEGNESARLLGPLVRAALIAPGPDRG
jgi:hypothetical protein